MKNIRRALLTAAEQIDEEGYRVALRMAAEDLRKRTVRRVSVALVLAAIAGLSAFCALGRAIAPGTAATIVQEEWWPSGRAERVAAIREVGCGPRSQQAKAWLRAKLSCDDPSVARVAAVWYRWFDPEWPFDAELRDQINGLIPETR